MARQFDALGANRRKVEVKLFGEADVLTVIDGCKDRLTVGAPNCQVAIEVLAEERFAVAVSDLGGLRGRRIHFLTGTGEVRLYRLAVWSELKR